ncbi:MAG: SDR family oxidoreductase [Firmicutes bacterium]|nr:SDR family oxidoreductase [Bacillota bacterium]
MADLSRFVALVTGGSRGIGAATAQALAQRGASVALSFVGAREQALAVVGQCEVQGAQAVALQCDLTQPGAAFDLCERARLALGPPSILVCNAGHSLHALAEDTSTSELGALLQVHVHAPYDCARAVIPEMRRYGFGRIVFVSSVWGLVGAAHESAYATAKGALIALTRSLAKEYEHSPVTVNCIAPGAIETAMIAHLSPAERRELCARIPLQRIGSPREVATAIAFLCDPASASFTGQVLSVAGGLELV